MNFEIEPSYGMGVITIVLTRQNYIAVHVLKAVKDVKKCDFFYYIIGKSVIRAFQSHYGH